MAKEHVHAEEVSHICTTLFTDLTHLGELETASGLTQASEIKKTTLSDKSQTPTNPRHRLRAATQDLDQMRALNGLLLLAIALSVLPSSAGALELGPCEPAKAVKIIDTSMGQRKTLNKPCR